MKNIINKYSIFLALILLLSNLTIGQSLIDTSFLFVSSKSGLNLRMGPNLDSEVITVVKYGETIFPIDDKRIFIEINDTKGKWIKVKHDGVIGYMFSGFLSKLPRPKLILKNLDEQKHPIYTLHKYFDLILFEIGQKQTLTIRECGDDPDCKHGVWKEIYPLNKEFQKTQTSSWDSYDMEIKGKDWTFKDGKDIVDSIIDICDKKYELKLIESEDENRRFLLYRNPNFTILIKELDNNSISIRWETSQ